MKVYDGSYVSTKDQNGTKTSLPKSMDVIINERKPLISQWKNILSDNPIQFIISIYACT